MIIIVVLGNFCVMGPWTTLFQKSILVHFHTIFVQKFNFDKTLQFSREIKVVIN